MRLELDRYWLLTWTTYGSWLPGDRRGFVSNVRAGPGAEVRHSVVGTPYDSDMPGLTRASLVNLKCLPIRLGQPQAERLLRQFRETALLRRWSLFAVSIMANHCHVVVGVPGDPDPSRLLGDLKSYGSRSLNQCWPKPASGTWWTESGSKRKLRDEDAVLTAVRYVVGQQYPWVLWTAAIPELNLPGGRVDPDGERNGERNGERGA